MFIMIQRFFLAFEKSICARSLPIFYNMVKKSTKGCIGCKRTCLDARLCHQKLKKLIETKFVS